MERGDMVSDYITGHIQRSIDTKLSILRDQAFIDTLAKAAQLCADTLNKGGKILFAGNGGSAADAQHLAAELVCRYQVNRRALAAIALSTDSSALTAVGNDFSFEEIFARQVAGLAQAGDLLIAISTSGNSPNILRACDAARQQQCQIIGLCGREGELNQRADICLAVPAAETATIQEAHIMLGHILCGLIEQRLFSEKVEQ